jgi:23S rRNA (cytidine1920-2'-O)/16S rRNA (cytidine1409-2'-O)-methyltransferase
VIPRFKFVSTEKKIRLDLLLVQKGLAESREKARAMIMAGLVEVDKVPANKPGHLFAPAATLTIKKSLPYVSRGGLKIEAALDQFSVDVRDRVVLDVGASTGGFTDCLLQRGAKRVVAVDVGYGQFHWKLREDPRVVLLEKTNIRNLAPGTVSEDLDGAVIDVSFISLKLVLPAVSRLLKQQAFVIALVKPQFEVGKGQVGKGGVVRDPALHQEVLESLCSFFRGADWQVEGRIPSPVLGPKGNKEFLVYLTRREESKQ